MKSVKNIIERPAALDTLIDQREKRIRTIKEELKQVGSVKEEMVLLKSLSDEISNLRALRVIQFSVGKPLAQATK